jgi:pimeloyl-ACP methyl ester carboxylesterase
MARAGVIDATMTLTIRRHRECVIDVRTVSVVLRACKSAHVVSIPLHLCAGFCNAGSRSFSVAEDWIHFRRIHGYRRAFVHVGKGPALLLIHGIGDRSDAWHHLIPTLARTHTVIAPDLLGHGRSDKPRADYSVAAYANAMRDLLTVLGIERATVIGHSLGGGVAMQFAYQYPERCERLVLVATGGITREVHPLLRLVSAPNADLFLPLLGLRATQVGVHAVLHALKWLGTDVGRDADHLQRVLDALPDATAQRAFVRTLRAVVDWRGQVITMLDRCYLTRGMPTLLVWGTRDAVVPYEHARIAHAAMPGSRLEIFEGAGHFPHHFDPERFIGVVHDFLATTKPASFSQAEWRAILRRGRPGAQDVIDGGGGVAASVPRRSRPRIVG